MKKQQFGPILPAWGAAAPCSQSRPMTLEGRFAANVAFPTRQGAEAWSSRVIKNLLVLFAGVWISSLGPIPLWVITLCLPIYFLCNSKWIQYFPISALNGSAL